MKVFFDFQSFSCTWPGSRSLKQLQETSCELNKKRLSVIGSPFYDKNEKSGKGVTRVLAFHSAQRVFCS